MEKNELKEIYAYVGRDEKGMLGIQAVALEGLTPVLPLVSIHKRIAMSFKKFLKVGTAITDIDENTVKLYRFTNPEVVEI